MSAAKRKLEDEFEMLGTIGRGSYGVVYRVQRRKSPGDILALKRVRLSSNVSGLEDGIPSSSLREIGALKSLKHPNILRLHDIIHTGTNLYLVLEHLDQDLKKTLNESKTGLGVKTTRNYMGQLLRAIAFCHLNRVTHRDLKLQNLLVNKDGTIKLADFGLARDTFLPGAMMGGPSRVYTKEVVTLWYRAPELLLGSNSYWSAVDIWSLGGIFYELLTKRVLFPGDSEIDQLFKIFQILGTPTAIQCKNLTSLPYYKPDFPLWTAKNLETLLSESGNISSGLADIADLLAKMLTYDPVRRISAKDALIHPFFDEPSRRETLREIHVPNPSL